MSFVSIETGYKPNVSIDDKKYLFFGGTSYLGLNYHPKYLKIFQKGVQIWGLNNGASRNNNIRLSIYDDAEKALAKDYDTEAALTFSSGWLAAQEAVKILSQNRDVYYVNDVHPALLIKDGPTLTLENAVHLINRKQQNHILIVSNSLNNIKPQIYQYQELNNLLPSKNVVLLLDHSHGFGLINPNPSNLPSNVSTVICGSLAKGLSLDCGVILGDEGLIDEIKKSAVFNGASPCGPAILYTYLNSQSIRQKSLKSLSKNLKYFVKRINKKDFYWVPNVPIVLIKNKEIAQKLVSKNVLFTSFPYPNADSETLNRLIITAAHTKADLNQLLDLINSK
jgi:8-amino-7-oxononanoate synthase